MKSAHNYEEVAAEVQRLRDERKRFDIEQLIVDLREYRHHGTSPEWSFDLDMGEAVERVRKFLDDHR